MITRQQLIDSFVASIHILVREAAEEALASLRGFRAEPAPRSSRAKSTAKPASQKASVAAPKASGAKALEAVEVRAPKTANVPKAKASKAAKAPKAVKSPKPAKALKPAKVTKPRRIQWSPPPLPLPPQPEVKPLPTEPRFVRLPPRGKARVAKKPVIDLLKSSASASTGGAVPPIKRVRA